MFLHLLTPEQQHTFFRAAGWLIASDGAIAQAEIDLLEAAQIEASIEHMPPAATSVAELQAGLAPMRGTPSARAFLLELAGVAVADGADDREREVLSTLATDLAIDDEELQRMIDVAGRAVAAQREASEMIAGA